MLNVTDLGTDCGGVYLKGHYYASINLNNFRKIIILEKEHSNSIIGSVLCHIHYLIN